MCQIVRCLVIILFLFGCAPTNQIVQKPKVNCGILPFESRSGMQAGETENVMDMLAALLQKTGRFTVIDRKNLNIVLQEQGFQSAQEGGDGISKAVKILAIDKMFSGSMGKLGDKYVLNLKMIDISTSEVALAISRTYNDNLENIGNKFLPDVVNEVLLAIE